MAEDTAPQPDRAALRAERRARRARREAMRTLSEPSRLAYGRGFLDGICAALRKGDRVIDCGANVGDVSEPLAQTGAHVTAFEPDPLTFAKLEERLKGLKNIVLHQQAVGAKASTLMLRRVKGYDRNPERASLGNTIVEGADYSDPDNMVPVEVIDFVSFIRNEIKKHKTVALLKIDIEGAEVDLLEALDEADLLKHVRCVLVETHEVQMPHLAERTAALRDRMAGKYRPSHVNLNWI